jgi:hypothetical protein
MNHNKKQKQIEIILTDKEVNDKLKKVFEDSKSRGDSILVCDITLNLDNQNINVTFDIVKLNDINQYFNYSNSLLNSLQLGNNKEILIENITKLLIKDNFNQIIVLFYSGEDIYFDRIADVNKLF